MTIETAPRSGLDIDQTAIPERNDHPYQLSADHQELADYQHNARCYYWIHWLGLAPPVNDAKKEFGNAAHTVLAAHYTGSSFDEAIALAAAKHGPALELVGSDNEFRTMPRLRLAFEQYLEDDAIQRRDVHWSAVADPEVYYTKPLGAEIEYGGKGDLIIFDDRDATIWWVDHKTSERRVDTDDFSRRHTYSPQIIGYHWLGEHVTRRLQADGKIPAESSFGGVLINGWQISKTLSRPSAIPCYRTSYELDNFVHNAYLLSRDILRRRQLTLTYLEVSEPAMNAWPNWPGFAEGWCGWRGLNTMPSQADADDFLSKCIYDPWWTRKRISHG